MSIHGSDSIFPMVLQSLRVAKKQFQIFSKRFHVFLTLLIFLYLFSLISNLLLPSIPPAAIVLASIVLGALNMVGDNDSLTKAVIEDLDKIPPLGHYFLFAVVAVVYVYFNVPVTYVYLEDLRNKIFNARRKIFA